MAHRQILDDLDQLISERSILKHPFYVAWERGELTAAQLATYARAYYPHVAAFPRHIETALAATTDDTIRSFLEENLDDELSNPRPHPELWLDFATAVGAAGDTVALDPIPAADHIIETFDRFARTGTAEALTALYAYESQQPGVSTTKARGLRDHYGVTDAKAVAYFDVHAEADIRHRDGERRALEVCLRDDPAPARVLDVARETLDAYWGLLDGICREAGIRLDPVNC